MLPNINLIPGLLPYAIAIGIIGLVQGAGVNPIFGLYSMIAGTTMADLFTSSVIMNVDSTGATALATLEALGGIPSDQQLANQSVQRTREALAGEISHSVSRLSQS